MKHLLLILFMSIGTLFTSAKPKDCIIVHLTGGNYVVFPLDGNPKVTFEGTVMSIGDERYQVSNVRKYTFGDLEETGITGVGDGGALGSYAFDGDQMVIRLADKSLPVRLYTVGGVAIPFDARPNGDGILRIPLPKASREVYLLQVGSETLKIRRP